jgi:hypothetical protein
MIITHNNKQAFEQLLEDCITFDNYPRWIFHVCRADHIKIEVKDIVKVYHVFKNKYNFFPSWIEKQMRDFADILYKKEEQQDPKPEPEPTPEEENIFFKHEFKNHYEVKKFLIGARKNTFANEDDYKNLHKQYFAYLSKPK